MRARNTGGYGAAVETRRTIRFYGYDIFYDFLYLTFLRIELILPCSIWQTTMQKLHNIHELCEMTCAVVFTQSVVVSQSQCSYTITYCVYCHQLQIQTASEFGRCESIGKIAFMLCSGRAYTVAVVPARRHIDLD